MKYLFLLLFFTSFFVNAQLLEEDFSSSKMGETRTIKIFLPASYTEENKASYPLILVLDADYLFDNVVANTKLYSYWEEMPEAIVVGINQKGTRIGDTRYGDESGFPEERGASFFEFIGGELMPHIMNTYKTSNFKMIVGHDNTANFINYYLFKSSPMFNAYVCLAPDFAPLMQDRLAANLAGATQKTFYYLATGENDDKKGGATIRALHSQLSSAENEQLSYFYNDFPNANENAVASYGIASALDQIFGMYKPISKKEYIENISALESDIYSYLENKYMDIETFFGFKKQVTLNDFMAIYAASEKREDFPSLEKLGKLALQEYPDTMLGFFFEAEFYEKTGEPKKALRTYEKAFGAQEIDFLTKDLILDRIDSIKADFGY